jgi:hypothetical protein
VPTHGESEGGARVSFPREAMGAAHDDSGEGRAFVDAIGGLSDCREGYRGRNRHQGDPCVVAGGSQGLEGGRRFAIGADVGVVGGRRL